MGGGGLDEGGDGQSFRANLVMGNLEIGYFKHLNFRTNYQITKLLNLRICHAHQRHTKKLGRNTSHRARCAQLVTSLIMEERLETTPAKPRPCVRTWKR